MEAGDDDVEFQVEPDQDDPHFIPPPDLEQEEEEQKMIDQSRHGQSQNGQDGSTPGHETNGNDFGNFSNPMFQQMQQMTQMLGGFNPMMGVYILLSLLTPDTDQIRDANGHAHGKHVWRFRA
jgi:hypothetical protein